MTLHEVFFEQAMYQGTSRTDRPILNRPLTQAAFTRGRLTVQKLGHLGVQIFGHLGNRTSLDIDRSSSRMASCKRL